MDNSEQNNPLFQTFEQVAKAAIAAGCEPGEVAAALIGLAVKFGLDCLGADGAADWLADVREAVLSPADPLH